MTLSLTLVLLNTVLAQAGAPEAPLTPPSFVAPAESPESKHEAQLVPAPPAPPDPLQVRLAPRKIGLFTEPQVGVGLLIGRGLLGVVTGAAALVPIAGVAIVVYGVSVIGLFAGATGLVVAAVVVLPLLLLAFGLECVAVALGASIAGSDYGKDFGDALVVSTATALLQLVVALVGLTTNVPGLAMAMLVTALALPLNVPFTVQLLKRLRAGPPPQEVSLQPAGLQPQSAGLLTVATF